MCGIWGYFKKIQGKVSPEKMVKFMEGFMNVSSRGPDRMVFTEVNDNAPFALGFHRLSIMDPSPAGDQPFILHLGQRTVYVICNGEIYNFRELADRFDIDLSSHSDCEIIGKLYVKIGFDQLMDYVSAECALCVVDVDHKESTTDVHISRDALGVRGLYYGEDDEGIFISSVMKGFVAQGKCFVDGNVKQFEPGTILNLMFDKSGYVSRSHSRYFRPEEIKTKEMTFEEAKELIKKEFSKTVRMMMISDQPVCALLSGGLDSSSVVAEASDYCREHGTSLKTFSIGMPGATDREYAEMVAKECDTDHFHIELDEEEFLKFVEEVIYHTESYDITTIRASVGQYLACKWIAENTDYKVVLIGDGADELLGGYIYFHKAPSPQSYQTEILKLLHEIHKYDGKRADRNISTHGLEGRAPFLNRFFVETVLSIPVEYRMPTLFGGRLVEKHLMREAIRPKLPKEVVERVKEAFSDGVSSKKKSWHDKLRDSVLDRYTDDQFREKLSKYSHCPPTSEESLYYREVYHKHFGSDNVDRVIDHFWLPNQEWVGDVKDPSARVLDLYK